MLSRAKKKILFSGKIDCVNIFYNKNLSNIFFSKVLEVLVQSPKESTVQRTAACQGKRNIYPRSTAAAHCRQRLAFGQKRAILHVLDKIISAALSAGWRVSSPRPFFHLFGFFALGPQTFSPNHALQTLDFFTHLLPNLLRASRPCTLDFQICFAQQRLAFFWTSQHWKVFVCKVVRGFFFIYFEKPFFSVIFSKVAHISIKICWNFLFFIVYFLAEKIIVQCLKRLFLFFFYFWREKKHLDQ